MAVTATAVETMKTAMNSGDPAKIASVLQKAKAGQMLESVDETITITAGTAIVLSTDSAIERAAMMVQSVRVVTGTATGPRQITDAGGTPSATVCTLSADGDTITFEANITVARIVWVPKPYADPDSVYAAV